MRTPHEDGAAKALFPTDLLVAFDVLDIPATGPLMQ